MYPKTIRRKTRQSDKNLPDKLGTKCEAIDFHFRWDVLAELVRRKRGRPYVSQPLNS